MVTMKRDMKTSQEDFEKGKPGFRGVGRRKVRELERNDFDHKRSAVSVEAADMDNMLNAENAEMQA